CPTDLSQQPFGSDGTCTSAMADCESEMGTYTDCGGVKQSKCCCCQRATAATYSTDSSQQAFRSDGASCSLTEATCQTQQGATPDCHGTYDSKCCCCQDATPATCLTDTSQQAFRSDGTSCALTGATCQTKQGDTPDCHSTFDSKCCCCQDAPPVTYSTDTSQQAFRSDGISCALTGATCQTKQGDTPDCHGTFNS